MADENWQRVRKIFDDARLQKPETRQKFVRQACGKNKSLLADVKSLLDSLDSAENFMEVPAVAEIAGQMLTDSRKFSKGQFLNHYEIIGQIGAGGMGEIYLAQDTKLFRRVALKILHENLLSDKQAKRRLLREAQAAALLDHPHICAIYEISETENCSFIVMQYVEGETLAEILTQNSLTAEKSLDLAIQIAEALAEAHARNLIHRDIKPANIIVSEKGQVKVLDFGLAKFIEDEKSGETAKRLNSSGAVMGTVPFMSPEQLCGKRLDARTDIFSFGALFYEMLAGRQAFARETNAETISAILNDEPDWSFIPTKLKPILQKSLTKNKDLRYKSAQNLAEALRDLQKSVDFDEIRQGVSTKSGEQVAANELTRPKSRQFYFWQSGNEKFRVPPETADFDEKQTGETKQVQFNPLIVPSVLIIFMLTGVSALFYWQFKKADDSGNFDALRSVRIVSWKSSASSNYGDYRVSNNGKMIAFSSTQDGKNEGIYVKQTADSEDIRVTKDRWTNHSPVWSPDDQHIAFVSVRESVSGIYVSPSLGGAAVALKIIGKGDLSVRNWTADGAAIFYEHDGNLLRLDLATQETVKITDFAQSPKDGRHFDLSPDEKQIVFVDESDGQIDLWTMPLAVGVPFRLTNNTERETRPLWHADGKRILYNVVRDNDMQIYLAFTDGRSPQQVTRGDGDYELADISADGTKVFYCFWENHSDIGGVKIETGEVFELASEIESELWADVSPDGKLIVFESNDSPHLTPNLSKSSLVVKSLENASSPLLRLKGHNPRWLPDSRHVAFMRWHKAEQNYQYWLVNTASGEEKQLTTDGVSSPSYGRLPINRHDTGKNWSPDANRFVYLDSKKQNILTASVESSENINLTDINKANIRFYPPIWSTDGKRIAFLSMEKAENPKWSIWLNEEGKTKEIYSGAGELRLLGWSASGDEILLAMTDGLMKSSPLDVKLLKVSAAGESRVLTVFKSIYASSLTLSADGKMLAFSARHDDKDDIWIAAASGREEKKITSNSHNRIFYGSPAWSADGKTVFFDKQDQINTISMFENFK